MTTEGEVPTYRAEIYIGGNLETAKQVCREFCFRGLCVTVEPTTYIYTGGEEAGVRVGLINYPRFPAAPDEIFRTALELGERLRDRLCQHSFSVVGSEKTHWSSTRSADTHSQWENLNATLGTTPKFR